MASSKDTFEGHSFRAHSFASGLFRGVSTVVAPDPNHLIATLRLGPRFTAAMRVAPRLAAEQSLTPRLEGAIRLNQ